MANIIPQRDIGGDLGRGFGQGLSEQLGQTLKARRLSSAVKELEQGGDFSKFLATPGAIEAFPAIKDYIRNKAGTRTSEPATSLSTQGGQPGAMEVEEFGNVTPKKSDKIFKPNEEIIEQNKKVLTAPTQQDYEKTLEQLKKERPYLSPIELENLASTRQGMNYKAQQENIKRVEKLADEGVSQILAQAGMRDNSKLEGQLLERVKEQLKSDVISGKSPEEAWNSVKGALSDMSAALANLRGGSRWGSKAESNIRSAYGKFKELGLEDRFPLYAAEMFDIPPMTVSQIVEPVKNKDFIRDAKLFKFGRDYKKMAESITPEDNIASMMDYLSDRGLDINKFKEAIDSNKKVKERLTREQKRQLLEMVPTAIDLMDKEFFKAIGR